MTHARNQIRDLVVAAISTNPGVTAVASRAYPVNQSEMPRYLVYTDSEVVDESMSTPGGRMRELSVIIDAVVATTEADVDEALDAHAVYIETQLNDSRLGGVVLKTILRRSDLIINTEGDVGLGILTLTYAVTYRTLPTDPQSFS
jgi:hypothetical protein